MKNQYLVLVLFLFFFGCKSNLKLVKNRPAKVAIVNSNGKYTLLVNNEPFYIKGAGLSYGDISKLAKNNANSFRTWTTNNGVKSGKEVLDEAYENGLMVAMGINLAKERHGFDYNNKLAVKKQYERIKKEVLELKDHPALLLWVIGNELNLKYTNIVMWDELNNISKMIHKIDPNHLTTTTLAGISQKEVTLIQEKCADLDILSIQMYGNLENLPQLIKKFDWKGPYIVSEWGATGHWQVPKTKWGAPIEENSSVKASKYLKRYNYGIKKDTLQCLGSYVFLWGQKQERTPTWYGMFTEDGIETASVDVMHYIWNNQWPKNRAPKVISFTLNEKTAYQNSILKKGAINRATILIEDFENDSISYRWEILPESKNIKPGGYREKKPNALIIECVSQENNQLVFKSPDSKGEYRLFVYGNDNHGHMATANIPFKVQ